MVDLQFILALVFGPRNTVWKRVAATARRRVLALQSENARLRRALDLLGVPAQATKDPDKAPPLHVSVALAKRAMEVVDG